MPELDLPAILAAIQRGARAADYEGLYLEFKEEVPDLKRTFGLLADAVVCLANAEGGVVVGGVRNTPDAHGRSIVGVSAKLTPDSVLRGVFARTKPPLPVPISEIEWDGVRLLKISVPPGVGFYSNVDGTATRRVGAACPPFTPEEQRQAAAARGQTDWSSELTSATLDALSQDELARLRRLLVLAGRDDLARSDDLKLLRDLRLVSAAGRVNHAGVLLLAREDELARLIPTYGYAYQYRVSPGSEATTRFRGARPILAAVDLLLEAVAVRSKAHPISAAGGVQLQMQDYPRDAVRELLVNALVHRDYDQQGSVEIEHSAESLSISNPGGLVFGVTPQNILTHPSTPRHRLLLETVTALQVAERTGQGIDRVYRELLRWGKQPPAIIDDGLQVRAAIAGGSGNDQFARFVADLDPALGGDVDVLLGLSILRDERTVTASRLSGVIQRTPGEAQATLDKLAHVGLVEPSRRTARHPFPTYKLAAAALAVLGPAVSYHYRGTDDTDRKVIEHIRAYGHITNQTLRRLFNLDLFAARNLLRDLQQRGLIEKLDAARGGPGIRYTAGPKFPASPAPRNEGRPRRGAQLELDLDADDIEKDDGRS